MSSSTTNKHTTTTAATPHKPSLAHLARCQDTLAAYIQHYITHNRPHHPITHLLVCAGHPDPKILVAICTAEQFAYPAGYTLIHTHNRLTGELETTKKAVDGGRYVSFNDVEYEIVFKEGLLVEKEGWWMDEEKFMGLFDGMGRARGDVLFFDLVEFGASGVAGKMEEEEREEEEREERRRGKKKEKKQKQRARKAAAKKAGDEVASPEEGGEAGITCQEGGGQVDEASPDSCGEDKLPERKPTWAEKAAFSKDLK